MKYLILSIVSLLLLFVVSSRSFSNRGFKLIDNRGVVYRNVKSLPEKTNLRVERFLATDDPNFIKSDDKTLPFIFFYPRDLIVSSEENRKDNGFEEYFTLPEISSEKIYSYPGILMNPEKTENNRSLFIKIINFNGSSKNTEVWLEEGQKIDKSKIINANGISFSSYLGFFGQKYNQLLVFSNGNKVGLIMLFAKDEPSFSKGREMLNVIISSLKWKDEKNNL